ncbi:translocator protein [Culex quinquefasciatus]|uniref:Translocator protein n=2 Tax=Culex pipiens complex TaxID=518105 RepID=B0WSJ2_CULQU|nr:translocator protein [Culex quinquefasciatus]|eukprot:XP_001852645.1 translocator protein [Culex quinquefasciatus]
MSGEIPKIVGAIALPQLGGWVNGYLTRQEIKGWYQGLNFPSFRPPNWVFGPVWTSLYAGMGYASYLVWRDGGGFNGIARGPLILYGAQLALNWAWTPIFFKRHELKWSFVELLALTGSVAATGFAFFNVNKLAGYLFIPYFAWCSFAALLNYEIYKRNPKQTATIEEITEGKQKL